MTDVPLRAPRSFRPPRALVLGLAPPVGLLVLWEVAAHAGWVDRRFLPPLETVATVGWTELVEGRLLGDFLASLSRDLLGFVIGCGIGVAVGALLGLSRLADRIVMPWFNGLKQIALVAWIPLISVWFGFDEAAKVVFVALAAAIPVILNTVEGIRSTPRPLVEVADVLRLGRLQRFRLLHLPAALPSVLTGVHLALIYAWLATVGAEYFMAVGPGIGGLIIAGRERFDMSLVLLGILILGATGWAIDRIAGRLERLLVMRA